MPKRGEPATPAQRSALRRGQEKRKKAFASASEAEDTQKQRWAKLLDGTLTVQDLTDEEITRMRVHGKGGQFSGRAQPLPSHLSQAFHREAIRRANDKLRTAAPEAVQALLDIGADPEVKEADRIRALMYIVDRALGKTPETIRVEGASAFDTMLGEAVGVARDLDVVPGEVVSEDGVEKGKGSPR